VRIRLDFQNQQARWQSVVIAPGGKLTWTVHAPQNSLVLNAIAWFEGSRKLGSYRSNPAAINHHGSARNSQVACRASRFSIVITFG
jgi:hypothetical protein